ncbi:hypothetical protein AB0F92_37495, partial [Kitasatospora aureofaciens]|uniref:hypothetical protein n=1 Tax=Kitasatospora aureofaciens TaxID=1894 RepID=UPI0033FBB7F1
MTTVGSLSISRYVSVVRPSGQITRPPARLMAPGVEKLVRTMIQSGTRMTASVPPRVSPLAARPTAVGGSSQGGRAERAVEADDLAVQADLPLVGGDGSG